jgi:GTP-binding protein EngB required for normal cell division
VDVVAQQVPQQQRSWSIGEILVMASIDGFYSPLERQMVEQVGQIWNWSSKKIQGFVESAKTYTVAQNIQNDSKLHDNLWKDSDYRNAIHQCTEIAHQDFIFTESALQAAKTILDNLKTGIEYSLETIQHKNSGNARAETAQEVAKQLETTKQSLEVEIVTKIKDVCQSLDAKQRALNYFSIAFMGKTKAGKSTLHAIMTGEGWDAIGVGKQRTTRLNRVYEWENIRIIDTPGIGAPGGKTDEEIAQSVINEADVICYLVTNDSIQESEFSFLRLLKQNSKPLIILLNVHKNFRDSRRGPYELDKFLKNPEKLFALEGPSGLGGHIERIRRYAQQHYGNDYFEIVPVMLLAGQLFYESEHQQHKDKLFQASQMQSLFNKIQLSLIDYGGIRRSQTLLGCTVGDIEKPYQWVMLQAETYKKSTERLQNKRLTIHKKIQQAANDASNTLQNEIKSIFKDALNAIPSFAEVNWDSSESTMESGWEQELKNIRFEERLNTAYKETITQFTKEVQDSLEEVGKELQLIAKLGGLTFNFNEHDSEDRRNFFRIGGGILAVAGAVMAFIPPLAPIGLIIGIVGGVLNFIGGFFKSKQQKRREAVENISTSLEKQIKQCQPKTISNALKQLETTCNEVKINVDNYFNDLIAGLDTIAQHLNSAQSQLEKKVDLINRAFAKRLLDWCCHRYEPLTQDCIDATIVQVRRDSIYSINITTKITLDLKVDYDKIKTIIQQSVTFEQPHTAAVKKTYQTGELVMTNLFETMVNFFEKDDWSFDEVESGKTLRLKVELENGSYICYGIADDENNSFRFYSISPVKIPKNKYLPIAEFLARANYGLILGNFEMDFRDGEIRYKTSIIVDSELSDAVLKRIVYDNLSTLDEYFPGFMKIIYGNISPEEAINQIENEE